MLRQFYQQHYQAVELLLNICDGAISPDNAGFSKYDTSFARGLYKQKEWTPRQANAVHRMLKKYQNQLSGMGIDYNTFPVPELKAVPDPVWNACAVNDKIELEFYSQDKNIFFATVSNIKDIPLRKWDKDKKKWIIPFSVRGIDKIKKLGFVIDDNIKDWYEKNTDPEIIKKQKRKYNPDRLAKRVEIPEMFQFQKEGLAFIEKMNGRALVGDEMGLGKTLQALAWLKLHPEVRPAVIIVPATLKINWQREAKKWINEDSFVINGRENVNGFRKSGLYIINYDIVKDHVEAIKNINPQCIVMDECHRIKNNKALRTKAVKKICKKVPHVICLSGTAILNRPIEIFNAINILQPEVFPSYYRFGQRYCDPKFNGFGTVYDGASQVEELHELLTDYVMIRRKKMDVLKDLPEKRKQLLSFEINNKTEYRKAEEDVIQFIYEQKGLDAAQRASRAEVLAKFNQLKQLSSQGKMHAIKEWITDFLETGEKLVLFAIHKKVITEIMEMFPDISVKIDGSTSQVQRQKAVDEFQNNDKIRLFIGNMPAAVEGITLTASSTVAFIELAWSPGIHLQGEDRIHRIGQKDGCMVYYLLAEGTIEEEIAEMIDRKQKIIDAVLDGKDTPEEALLTELLNKYKEKAA